MHATLRRRARKVDPKAITSQRLKRQDSIIKKLLRSTTVTMELSQMQDIGGGRAIVSGMRALRELKDLYERTPLRHSIRVKDYIETPRNDGYRSLHLMYRFAGAGNSMPWDRMRIELQIRTRWQHAWATAVETVDAFTGQDLKHGKGNPEWKRFFSLMASAIAMFEGTTRVPNTPIARIDLLSEIKRLNHHLGAAVMLHNFTGLNIHIERKKLKATWYLLKLFPEEGRLNARGFTAEEFQEARDKLQKAEQEFRDTKNMALLVSVSSMRELKRAYPNYFADTFYFITLINSFARGRLPTDPL